MPRALTHINVEGSVAREEMKVFKLRIFKRDVGRRIFIRTSSADDVDLYIEMDSPPSVESYLQRTGTTSGSDLIVYRATHPGTLYIGVHGSRPGQFVLRTADE